MTGIEYSVILPTIWDYIHEDFNANGMFMGLMLSAFSLSGSIAGVFMGQWSDKRHSSKLIIVIANLFEIIGNLIYCLGINKYMLLLSRFISGIGMGASPVLLALIARHTKETDRTSTISYVMSSRQLGLMFGPVFNFFLRKFNLDISNYVFIDYKNAPGFFMFIMWSLMEIFIWLLYYEADIQDVSVYGLLSEDVTSSLMLTKKNYFKEEIVGRKEICILLCTTLIIYLNQTALETIVTPFTKSMFNWNDIDNSILFSVAGIEIILVYAAVRFLSTFMNDRTLLFIGFSLMISSLVIGVVFLTIPEQDSKKSFVAFVLFVVIDLIGLPVLAVCSTSLFTKMTKKKYQGVAQGIQRFFLGLGTIFGPLLAGPLIGHVNILLEILLVLSAFLFGFTFLFYDHLEPVRFIKN